MVLILGLMLVMIAFVGIAIDTSATVHARQAVFNELNTATVAAATQVNPNGTINTTAARNIAVDTYMKNRRNIPILRCSKSGDVPSGGSLQGDPNCRFAMTKYQVRTAAQNKSATGNVIDTASVTMSVRECSPNFFLSVLIKETCFTVTSTGRLSSALQG